MATGYTADVGDGKVTDFVVFALSCARNFGALLHMRDDPADVEIRECEMSTYSRDGLAKARTRLAHLDCMSADEAAAEATHEHEKLLRGFFERKAKRDATRQHYEAMLGEVRAWEPPTAEHVGLKEFMESQLVESIHCDCLDDDPPKPCSGAKWLEGQQRRAERNIEYNAEQWEREQARVRLGNEWVRALRVSLDHPASATLRD